MENEKNGKSILALDGASKKTGYAIYCEGHIIKHGTWKLKDKYHKDLYDRVNRIILQYKIDCVVSEDIFRSKDYSNCHAYPVLAECKGIVNLLIQQNGLEGAFISPVRVKEHIWARHRPLTREVEKQKMIQVITNQYGYQLKSQNSDDEADAIGLLITFLDSREYHVVHPKQLIQKEQ